MKWFAMNNFPLKLIAVIFAVFLWFYAGAVQDPLISKSFEVPIDYQNQDESLYLSNQIKAVTITVKGRGSVVSNLRGENFSAEVDLANLEVGYHELPVLITTPKGADYATVSPNKVKTEVDELSEKHLSVKVVTTGSAAEGYSSALPSVQPATVVVKGPLSLLKTVTSAQVEVDLAKAQNNMTVSLPVSLLNQNKEAITNQALSVQPLKVSVYLPVNQNTTHKVVPIKALLSGNVAKGFTLGSVVTDPETIEITGTEETLSKVDQIQTQGIVITDLSKGLVEEVELKLPAGVSVLGSNKVKVAVSVSESSVTEDVALEIGIRNEKSQWTVSLAESIVRCSVEGRVEDLANQEKLVAFVDLAGLEPGVHMVPVGIENGEGVQIKQLSPEAVEVTITEVPVVSEPSDSSDQNV